MITAGRVLYKDDTMQVPPARDVGSAFFIPTLELFWVTCSAVVIQDCILPLQKSQISYTIYISLSHCQMVPIMPKTCLPNNTVQSTYLISARLAILLVFVVVLAHRTEDLLGTTVRHFRSGR